MPRLSPGASSPGLPTLTVQWRIGFFGPAGRVGSPTCCDLISLQTGQASICGSVLGRSARFTTERLWGSFWPGVANSNVRSQPERTVTLPGTYLISSWRYRLTTYFSWSVTFTVAPQPSRDPWAAPTEAATTRSATAPGTSAVILKRLELRRPTVPLPVATGKRES